MVITIRTQAPWAEAEPDALWTAGTKTAVGHSQSIIDGNIKTITLTAGLRNTPDNEESASLVSDSLASLLALTNIEKDNVRVFAQQAPGSFLKSAILQLCDGQLRY